MVGAQSKYVELNIAHTICQLAMWHSSDSSMRWRIHTTSQKPWPFSKSRISPCTVSLHLSYIGMQAPMLHHLLLALLARQLPRWHMALPSQLFVPSRRSLDPSNLILDHHCRRNLRPCLFHLHLPTCLSKIPCAENMEGVGPVGWYHTCSLGRRLGHCTKVCPFLHVKLSI